MAGTGFRREQVFHRTEAHPHPPLIFHPRRGARSIFCEGWVWSTSAWTLDDENPARILPGREQRKGGECQGGQYPARSGLFEAGGPRNAWRPDLPMTSCSNLAFFRGMAHHTIGGSPLVSASFFNISVARMRSSSRRRAGATGADLVVEGARAVNQTRTRHRRSSRSKIPIPGRSGLAVRRP